jgi:hypothetical protein
MSYLGNSPSRELVIRLEARKSFELGLWLKDSNGRGLDLTGCTIVWVAKKPPLDPADTDDSDNLFTNGTAQLVSSGVGYARFNLQASDLDHKAGEYPYSIILIDPDGYSSVLAKGTLEILVNTEYASVGHTYSPANPPTSLNISLRDKNVVEISTGPTLAPNTTSFTDADKAKLDGIEAGAQAHIPADWNAVLEEDGAIRNKPHLGTAAAADIEEIALPSGGLPGEVIMKVGLDDTDVAWQTPPVGPGGGNLDATGATAGQIPTASGVDTWSWDDPPAVPVQSVNLQTGDVSLDLDNIPDTATRLAMTPAERDKLENLSLEWDDITDKPAFGTAALEDTGAFLAPGGVNASTDLTSGTVPNARLPKVSDQPGFSKGTSAPAGGADGDLYFQYT